MGKKNKFLKRQLAEIKSMETTQELYELLDELQWGAYRSFPTAPQPSRAPLFFNEQ